MGDNFIFFEESWNENTQEDIQQGGTSPISTPSNDTERSRG